MLKFVLLQICFCKVFFASLDLLCVQLSQSDSTLSELHQSSLDDALTRAKKANIVSFAVSAQRLSLLASTVLLLSNCVSVVFTAGEE